LYVEKIPVIPTHRGPGRMVVLLLALLTAGGLAMAQGDKKREADPFEVSLPSGVKAVWDLGKADREKTPTRERVCLNGLWRWQPAREIKDAMPAGGWGYFKVPGFWPGNSSYIQEDCQTLHVHPSWKDADLRLITAAWYQREMTVPEVRDDPYRFFRW
jgi:hypothetical protein